MDDKCEEGPILYVLVIGFHHKKGCQVEFSFPPLVPGAPNECPAGWKYLPTLALPDGSHNYEQDTVFFHLPSLTNPKQTVYGISCFRQIPVERLKNKTADITRGTVQKSVCVLSKIPLFGQIQVKMSLITHAYFEEGDFSKVSILEDTFHHLNGVLTQNDLQQQMFVGLSARDFILQWKHKALLLFKLVLLEKRVMFYKSPVHPLCSTILTLISLFPQMIEKGLSQSACIRLSRPMSPMPDYLEDDSPVKTPSPLSEADRNKLNDFLLNNEQNGTLNDFSTVLGEEVLEKLDKKEHEEKEIKSENFAVNNIRRDISTDTIDAVQNNLNSLAHVSTENCGFPLAIFTKGALCLPYLSLPYLDLLTDVNVRSYIVGATNVLFKQKKQLYDIFVDIDSGRIECQDMNLRKHLHLTTEDLRFADYIVKHVSEERQDVFLDGVGWEGGDEWIRTQFRIYLLCLLRTSMLNDGCREIDLFNANFVSAWRDTHNYKIWLSSINPGILDVNPGHPFAGQLSMADMKLRFTHTMQNTESGRKLNQAMMSTGRVVATTSKAVGGALSQAKGAFSSWWSNLMVTPETVGQKTDEAEEVQASCDFEANSNNDLIDTMDNSPVNDGNIEDYSKNTNGNANNLVNITSDVLDKENCIKEVDEKSHKPGEVHTV